MALPRRFCWTRFGTEAGECVQKILARKEAERVANAGVFLWGIGNAIGPSMRQLVSLEGNPEVIFSPIRSAPRVEDVNPAQVVMWASARTIDGERYDLPSGSMVTSRSKAGVRVARHYALICASPVPLQIDPSGDEIEFRRLRNIRTGRPIGASQVTAIVQLAEVASFDSSRSYMAAFRAELVSPYVIELIDPVTLGERAPLRRPQIAA